MVSAAAPSDGLARRNAGTKKVPSDPLCSSFASRHARPELGIQGRLTVRPLLPEMAFGHSGSTLRTSSTLPWRSRHLETAFRSPGAAVPFETTSPGSLLPACLFSAASEPASDPFGCRLPLSPSALGGGKVQCLQPVARAICPALRAVSQALLPVGTFRSLRLNARPGSPLGKLTSAMHPISAHSPPAPAFILSPPDQRSRSALLRGARCSANLLEPSLSSLQSPGTVK